MADDPAYILDLSHSGDAHDTAQAADAAAGERPWIGVKFECCGVYTRIYRNRHGDAYEGYCPRCNRPLRIKIGPGGTSNRMFRAQ